MKESFPVIAFFESSVFMNDLYPWLAMNKKGGERRNKLGSGEQYACGWDEIDPHQFFQTLFFASFFRVTGKWGHSKVVVTKEHIAKEGVSRREEGIINR